MMTYASGEQPELGDLVECVSAHPAKTTLAVGNRHIVTAMEREGGMYAKLVIGFEFDAQPQWAASRFKLLHRAATPEGWKLKC